MRRTQMIGARPACQSCACTTECRLLLRGPLERDAVQHRKAIRVVGVIRAAEAVERFAVVEARYVDEQRLRAVTEVRSLKQSPRSQRGGQ